MSNACEVATDAAVRALAILAVTVTPRDFLQARDLLSSHDHLPSRDLSPSRESSHAPHGNVSLALGLHPWWLADGRCTEKDLALFEALAPQTRWLGEVGMDFSPKHVPAGTEDLQREAFRRICLAAAGGGASNAMTPLAEPLPDPIAAGGGVPTAGIPGPRVLSIHSVRSATACLDILEETGCIDRCRCVFHWFTGSSDELHRAVLDGCWFSVNQMMLQTRRGREYARQVPLDRLLTETDYPPGEQVPFSADRIKDSLEAAIEKVAVSRYLSSSDLQAIIAQNARTLLGP